MYTTKLVPYSFLLLLMLAACTPKTTEQTTKTNEPSVVTTPTPKPDENLSPCPKFSDAPNPDDISDKYAIYHDFMRAGEWNEAFALWQEVYAVAPAADGRRNTVYADGIQLYEYFISQDTTKKAEYIPKIFQLYDDIEHCYPSGSFAKARKAFDLYYNYPEYSTPKQTYDLFKEVIDKEGLKTQDFVVNPFTALLVDMYFDNQITMAEAQTYQQKVRDLLANGLATCKGDACERWKIIEQYVPERLAAFETERGFYDCAYYKEQYYKDFLAASTDCDTIRLVYSRLKWGNCPETDAEFAKLIEAGNQNCRVEPTAVPVAREAYACLENADYNCAIQKFEQAANEAATAEKKGDYLLLISKIYYSHLRNYPKARQYALQAASVRSGWGEPYILIGKLYASSGPLCGSGTGWNSQVVTWPAIDMWNRAKSIDPKVASEANKNIRTYTQYMPSVEDIFQRGLREGQSFTVGCWIQETTTIRAAPN